MLYLPYNTSITGRIRSFKFHGLVLLLMAFIFMSAVEIKLNADFKGEWTFNEQKSKLSEGRFRMNAQRIKVSQQSDSLVIERTLASPSGENMTSIEKITFDGKFTESTIAANFRKKSSAAWSQDGQQMTINSTISYNREGNPMEIKVTEIWKLAENGKALSIDVTAVSERGTSTNTFVYDKK